jgi:hypothetical protein
MQTDAFQGLLLKGERIIWLGQPAQGLLFTSKDGFMVPLSLFFLGFSVFWESTVMSAANSPTFMRLWESRSCLSGCICSSVALW